MSQINTNAILDASGGSTTSINGFTPSVSNMAGRNRIINGDMRVAQRGTSAVSNTTSANIYPVDRFAIYGAVSSKFTAQQNAGAVTPPTGFSNYLGCTSSSAYTVGSGESYSIYHNIEGYNIAGLGWGSSDAKNATLSFWVRSSLTGTQSVTLRNQAQNRSYPATYTINSANTWEYKTIVIPAETSGTWVTNNTLGVAVIFNLGSGAAASTTANAWASANYVAATGATSVVGTSGATFYITGVQLEEGSVATPFEHRQYGQELALCQRYYNKFSLVTYQRLGIGYADLNSRVQMNTFLPVMLRTTPTATFSSVTVEGTNITSIGSIQGDKNLSYVLNHGSSYASGETWQVYSDSANGYIDFSAEL